jgi:2-isopropylmalate synthase
MKLHDDWLSNVVYSGVPADMVGRRQRIEVGPMSGLHNVRFWLEQNGLWASDQCQQEILQAAKRSNRLLTTEEIMELIQRF